MSGERKEIDLIFRAALEGGKTFETVAKSIAELEVALDEQSAAAKRGESSIDSLKATLEGLKRVQSELAGQHDLVGQFKALTEQIAKSEEKVAKAAQTHTEYTAKLEKVSVVTEAQSNKVIKLAQATERAQRVLDQQRATYSQLEDRLVATGVATDNLAGAQSRIREAAAQAALAQVKVNNAIHTYVKDVADAKAAEKALLDEKVFQQKLDDAAKLNKAGQYVAFWTNALQQADAAEERLKTKEGLRKVADEAIAATKGYNSLGASMQSLKGSAGGLHSAIEGIIDPSAKANSTLSGVEQTVSDLGSAIAKIEGPVNDYAGKVRQLADAQKAIASQAGIVDAFSRQVGIVRQAAAAYASARGDVAKYADQLRAATGNTEAIQASLRKAQGVFADARKHLAAQKDAYIRLRQSMREAELGTKDLTATQERLTSAARGSTSALRGLQEAHVKHGDAVKSTTQAFNLFNSGGRTTLSLTQRIRGQVLSLAAAYVSLFGVINGAKGAIDAAVTKQNITNQLSLVVGNDSKAIAAEWKYLEAQADRLGVSLDLLAKGYAKFLASSIGTKESKQNMRFMFETFTEVGRVAGVTRDDMDGIFKALGQILSKGKFQAEELRGQLGDRIFGVFGIAKEALKSQFPEFDKALKEGKVTAEYLLQISEAYKKLVAGQLPAATKSMQAAQERLNTELFVFKTLIAESGFADAYVNLIKSLTTFFKSTDGREFAKGIAHAFSVVADGIKFLLDNLNTLGIILKTVLVIYAQRELLIFGKGISETIKLLKGFQVAAVASMGSAAVAVRAVGLAMKGLFAINVLFIAVQAGQIIFEQSTKARKFFVILAAGATEAFLRIKAAANIILAEELPNTIENGLAKTNDKITGVLRHTLTMLAMVARAMGKEGLAKAMETSVQSLTIGTGKMGSEVSKIREQLSRDIEQLRRDTALALKEAEDYGKPDPPREAGASGATPNAPRPPPMVEQDVESANKRLQTRKQLEKELAAIEVLIAKREKDTLGDRLHAIDMTYNDLEARIREFGGSVSANMLKALNLSKAGLGAQVIEQFEKELTTAKASIEKRLQDIDIELGKKDKTNAEARLRALQGRYEEFYADIEKLREKLEGSGKSTAKADEFKLELDARMKSLAALEETAAAEARVNALIADRDAQLEVINVRVKANALTQRQGDEETLALIQRTQPEIEKAVEAAIAFVTALRDAAVAAGESTAAFDAMLSKMIVSGESAKGLRKEFLSAAEVNEMLATGATSAFQTMSESIGQAVIGIKSWKDAIGDTARAFAKFAADFLMKIAQMIIQRQILAALEGGLGGDNFITKAVGAIVKHEGGVVGAGGTSRQASAAWFVNAPRYHGGGVPGLAPDEYAAILKRNEEVLTQGDPRNVLNGGKAGISGGGSQQAIKVINMIDSGSVVSEGLGTREGEQSFFNFIRANRTGLKQILA